MADLDVRGRVKTVIRTNKSMFLNCSGAYGHPDPTYKWTKDNAIVQIGFQKSYFLEALKNSKKSETIVKCTAYNDGNIKHNTNKDGSLS